jgi:hypothetical protein
MNPVQLQGPEKSGNPEGFEPEPFVHVSRFLQLD